MKMYSISEATWIPGQECGWQERRCGGPRETGAEGRMPAVLADKEIGILLLTGKIRKEFPDIIDHIRLERNPLIVEILTDTAQAVHRISSSSYVNEAIGINI